MKFNTVAAGVLVISLICSGAAKSDAAKSELTENQATSLAQEAMKKYHPGVHIDLMPGQSDPAFFEFEALSDNPSGSPVVGHFSVNKSSGDVWDLAGHCRYLTSASLQEKQKEIRQELGRGDQYYRQARKKKPECDADF
jgi:hypothetical protein